MGAPQLGYATPGGGESSAYGTWSRRRVAVVLGADVVAFAFLLSQLSFLLAMMITNIGECGVAPYGQGSSYEPGALGNAWFVRSFPGAAGWIVRLPQEGLEMLGWPALVGNVLSCTVGSYVATGYLVWRCFRSSGVSRVVFVTAAGLMAFTLLWVWAALGVYFD